MKGIQIPTPCEWAVSVSQFCQATEMNMKNPDKRGPHAALRLDHPLRVGKALGADALHRAPFARSVTEVLKRVSPEAGLVASLEGVWGSGKTSMLAMVEELFAEESEETRPVVVHFNPWLIGDREALLRQFFASIAMAVKLTDHAKEGKRVAKELKTYSKAFDVLKLIPGAEPWASMVKAVVESMGNATEAVADYKTPDIEARKQALEKALRKFPRRIIVFVDDLDRLFPAEAFEMVRIVKAVGDLPNIGYVLAWDASYVSAALENLKVPLAATYLDKIVQVRLPIPPLSFRMRVDLMNNGLNGLPEDAHKPHLPNGEDRHALLFHHGLSELMEQPRDVVRLFDVVRTIEPGLRGEIHLADIIGLACLMTKAAKVYELLHRIPQAFVGRRPGSQPGMEKSEDVVKEYAEVRDAAIAACSMPNAVRDLVSWLFPMVTKSEEAFTFARVEFVEGHLAHPERLLIALNLSAHPSDLSLVKVQQFVLLPAKREGIAKGLHEQSCIEFISNLGEVAAGLRADVELDVAELCIAIARLADSEVVVRRAHLRQSVWEFGPTRAAVLSIEQIAKSLEIRPAEELAEKLIADPIALSIATQFAHKSFLKVDDDADSANLKASQSKKAEVLGYLADNVEAAAASGALFNKSGIVNILWALPRLVTARCDAVFRAIAKYDPALDLFVEALLRDGFDSNKGQIYKLPDDVERLEKYVPLDVLKSHATQRLKDESMPYPTKAAWQAVIEGYRIYGIDGSKAED